MTTRKDAPTPYEIRKRQFSLNLEETATQLVSEIEIWIKERRTKDVNLAQMLATVQVGFGESPVEFVDDGREAINQIVAEYRYAGWNIKINDSTTAGGVTKVSVTICDDSLLG